MLLGTALVFLVLKEIPLHQTAWVAVVLIGLNAVVVVRNPAIVRLRSLRRPSRLVASVAIGASAVAPTQAATQLLTWPREPGCWSSSPRSYGSMSSWGATYATGEALA
ncbi:hypothetical protein [Nocardia sp. NPDC004604]|uniref:hypothetical protein n=1 Tax=Nocardia sp. NPDC004604 TaxID=3157013 RepID=UPI0033BC47B5